MNVHIFDKADAKYDVLKRRMDESQQASLGNSQWNLIEAEGCRPSRPQSQVDI